MRQKSEKERQLWAQFDALQLGTGWEEDDIGKLQILVEDVYGDSHPGSAHLDAVSRQAVYGVFEEGAFPAQFHVTDICDGCGIQGSDLRYAGDPCRFCSVGWNGDEFFL